MLKDETTNGCNFKNELLSIFRGVQTTEIILLKLKNIINNLGFSDVDIAQVDIAQKKGSDEVGFLLNSLPPSLLATYHDEKYYENDIIMEYLIHATSPVFESKAFQYIVSSPFFSPRFHESSRPHHLMKSYGYNDCYTIPVAFESTGEKYIFSVLEENASEINFQKNIKDKQNQLIDLSRTSCKTISNINSIAKTTIKESLLSNRQVEILKSVAKDSKGFKQVADQYNISIRTVQKHINDIKQKLGAHSLANAVFLAIQRGYLN